MNTVPTILLADEGGRNSIERAYIHKLVDYFFLTTDIRINIIPVYRASVKTADKALEYIEAMEKKKGLSDDPNNILKVLIRDTDNDTTFTTLTKSNLSRKNIVLIASNRSFEQWIEYHRSTSIIPQSTPLSVDRKKEFFNFVKNNHIGGHLNLKKAYSHCKSLCISANDDPNNPFCLGYAGSDMFHLIDLLTAKCETTISKLFT